MKVVKAKLKIWKENQCPLVYIKIFTDDYYKFGDFPRMGIMSRQMNTIVSRDQFTPIKIEENFLVSYDGLWKRIQNRLPFKVFSE